MIVYLFCLHSGILEDASREEKRARFKPPPDALQVIVFVFVDRMNVNKRTFS